MSLPSEPHPIDQLSNLGRQVADAINQVRTQPRDFINRLQSMRSNVGNDNVLRFSWGSVQTTEGTLSYDEAIAFLTHMKPMAPLSISTPMCRANENHAKDLGTTGKTGHVGTDGFKAAVRLKRSGGVIVGGGRVSEGIEFGPWKDGADFVVSLIVGDGESNRTHRKILLDPSAGACGIAMAQHKLFGSVCVVTLAPNCELSSSSSSSVPLAPTVHVRKNTMHMAQTMSLPSMSPVSREEGNSAAPSPIHVRKNTMQLAQTMSLPTVLEETNDGGRRNTMHRAAGVPLGGN